MRIKQAVAGCVLTLTFLPGWSFAADAAADAGTRADDADAGPQLEEVK